MGNIMVTRNGPQLPTATPARASWEPSRWIARMMGFDPFSEMVPFVGEERFAFEPAFEVKETKEGYLFKADVPAVKQSDIDVSLTGNRLTISGKREAEKEDKGEKYYTYERSYGSFTRSFTLPEGVDETKTHAELRDGVLSVLVPKKPESLPKKIPVDTAAAPQKKV
jgi:HSP20 family protein